MSIRIENICVPTDFSDCAEAAVRHGAALAQANGAKLHLVHVLHDLHEKFQHPDFTREDTSLKAFFQAMEHGASEHLARIAARRAGAGTPVEKVYLYGETGAAVVRYVEKNAIDLVVVGHHGRSGALRPTLGATAQRIVRDSPVPVLVVPWPHARDLLSDNDAAPPA